MEKGRYTLVDRSGHGEHVVIQGGWSDRSKDMVRFNTKQGSFVCKRKELLAILFYIGDVEEQQSMVTKKLRKVVYSQREVAFTAQRPYKQGERVLAMVEVPVEMSEEQPIRI